MVGQSERLFVPSGSMLFNEGEAGTAAYLVVQGRVALLSRGGARPHQGAELGPGQIVGETALVDARPHSVSAMAVNDCECIVLTREAMSARMEGADPMLRLCLGALLERQSRADPAGQPAAFPWSDHFAAARETLTFDFDLRRAIDRRELELYFQPMVRLSSRQLVGFEALLRWNHPERGMILPSHFIPPAERSGTIVAVTSYLFGQVGELFPALDAAAEANPVAVAPLFISVNVTGTDLRQPTFAASAVSILCDAGVEPSRVRLEITESVLIEDAEQSTQTLEQCRAQGMRVAIDDFGTGYSSLNYLNMLPVSTLKLDRCFTASLLGDGTGRKIIGAMLQLGRELDLTVVAEGIEQTRQADMLTAMGCDLGQGFLFGEPRNLRDTLGLIQSWTVPGNLSGPVRLEARRA